MAERRVHSGRLNQNKNFALVLIDGASHEMYIFMYMKARRYSIARARAELPSILRAVEKGAEVELSRRGAPVAVILSVADRARLSARKSFGDAFDAFVAASPQSRKAGRDAFSRRRGRSPGRKVRL